MKDNIIYILKVLERYSDKEHPLTQAKIIEKIYYDYSVKVDRRTISGNIETLVSLGYEIVILKKGGYYYNNRVFTKNEATYIMDALYSSQSLNSNQARNLVDKIKNTFSIYDQKDYNYVFKSYNMINVFDETIFDKIDKITYAIKNDKQIEFYYMDYDKYGIERKSENKRAISPYYFINNKSKYYILSIDSKNNIVELRLDRMSEISLIDVNRIDFKNAKGYKPGFNVQEYANEHIYMFESPIVNATLHIKSEKYVKDVVDWFGNQTKIAPINGKIYASIRCDERSLIYWALQYGDEITIIRPQDTRLKALRMINRLSKDYLDEDYDFSKFDFKQIIDEFMNDFHLINNVESLSEDDIKKYLIERLKDYYFNLVTIDELNDKTIALKKKDGRELYKIKFKYLDNIPTKEDFYSLIKDIKDSENNNTRVFVLTKSNKYYFIDDNLIDDVTKYFKKENTENFPLKRKIDLRNGESIIFDNLHTIKWTIKKVHTKDFYGYYII